MPYLGSTLFVVVLVFGLLASMGAFVLLVSALWPHLAAQAQHRFTHNALRCVLLGVPLGGGLTVLALVVSKAPLPGFKLLGLVLLSVVVALGLIGLTGLCARIASGLEQPGRLTRAVTILLLSFVLPVLGWFVIFPLALFAGFGAVLLSVIAPIRARAADGEPSLTAAAGHVQPA